VQATTSFASNSAQQADAALPITSLGFPHARTNGSCEIVGLNSLNARRSNIDTPNRANTSVYHMGAAETRQVVHVHSRETKLNARSGQ